MTIPQHIKNVLRPKNTVIIENKTIGNYKYAVRERTGYKKDAKGKMQPVYGKVIGYIVDNNFQQISKPHVQDEEKYYLSFGSAAFIYSVTKDIYEDLLKAFSARDAEKIITISCIRVMHPYLSCYRYSTEYKKTFLSLFFPGVPLSKNTILNFLQGLGKARDHRVDFFLKRLERVQKTHKIVIDGMLKQNTSIVNDLSAYSRKSRVKGCRDISLLYAYDIDLKEPIAATVYADNTLDCKAFRSFVVENQLYKGVIIADKGFNIKEVEDIVSMHKDLHYIIPIRRNDRRVIDNNMLDFNIDFTQQKQRINAKKIALRTNRYLYSFKDFETSINESRGLHDKIVMTEDEDTKQKLRNKKLTAGVIVFESDLDLDAQDIYKMYQDRWALEVVFDRFKNDLFLNRTNVQNDFSVIGSEFINFISTLITCRLIKKIEATDLFKKYTYKSIMSALHCCWRFNTDIDLKEDIYLEYNDLSHVFEDTKEIMIKLGLMKDNGLVEIKKTGRPKIKPTIVDYPRRRRGRPRTRSIIVDHPKRKRGRPKKVDQFSK